MQQLGSRAVQNALERVRQTPFERADEAPDLSAHAVLTAHRPLGFADEDRGADPYNRTGRFRRTVR